MSTRIKQLRLQGFGLCLATLTLVTAAFPQTKCQRELEEARTLTRNGLHSDALTLVNTCLNQKKPDDLARAEAYKLLGVVSVALHDNSKAKAAFLEMLQLQPLASLDSNESPEAIKIFEETRIDFFSATDSKSGTKNWPWIAVAGAVVATVGALLFLQ